MKLVTSAVPAPVGQMRRIGAIHRDKIIDLSAGYTRYLTEKHGTTQSCGMAAAGEP